MNRLEFNMNKNNIFIDFLYNKETIDISNTNFADYFEDEDIDSTKVTPANLLFVAHDIANNLSCVEGMEFMIFSICVASYILNKKE